MSNKIQTAFFILFFIVLIGGMSWRNMHPQPINLDSHGDAAHTIVGYYLDDRGSAAAVPDDDRPLTIAQGEFKYGPRGETRFTHQGIPPTLFAQRDIRLLLKLERLPKNPEKTFVQIDALLQDWAHQGTSVSSLVLDYHPKKIDFKAYSTFITGLAKHLRLAGTPRAMIAVADTSWLDNSQKTCKLLEDNIGMFLFEIPSLPLPPALLQAFAHFGDRFQLKLPGTEVPSDNETRALEKIDTFGGSWSTLDAHTHPPKKSDQMVLFPKL
ncbi:MAG: hypothetical protein HY052_06815 [Proteobacteria bacterium]|nr:hypothetical protein [Pseudomonadota bacterium]